jgi:hypothetical protein
MMTRSSVRPRARGASRGRKGRQPQFGAIEFFTRPEQHIVWRVLGLMIRARAELTGIAVVVTVWFVASDQFGPDATIIGMATVTLVVFAVPVSRRFVVRRVWCVITRHRMRTCFAQTRTMTHHGRMPFLWWSRPSPVGERLRVWLPAGLCVKDLENNRDELAAACWAREVRITPVRSQAALVIVDVVRRNPLGGAALAPSVVDDLDDTEDHAGYDGEGDGVVVPLPDRSTATRPPGPTAGANGALGPSNGHRPDRSNGRSNGRKPAEQHDRNDAAEAGVTGFGGMDVSDYI